MDLHDRLAIGCSLLTLLEGPGSDNATDLARGFLAIWIQTGYYPESDQVLEHVSKMAEDARRAISEKHQRDSAKKN